MNRKGNTHLVEHALLDIVEQGHGEQEAQGHKDGLRVRVSVCVFYCTRSTACESEHNCEM